jgi:hypothetical protein
LERRFEVKDRTGAVVAVHGRIDHPNGQVTRWWEDRDGHKKLGVPLRDLPPYGIHRVATLPPGTVVVYVEGEPAADALWKVGRPAVATYGTSALPSDAVLRQLVGYRIALWPDADSPDPGKIKGPEHMRELGRRLACAGVDVVGWVRWEVFEGGDAADAVMVGGGWPGRQLAQLNLAAARTFVERLIEAAEPWSPASAKPTRVGWRGRPR